MTFIDIVIFYNPQSTIKTNETFFQDFLENLEEKIDIKIEEVLKIHETVKERTAVHNVG